MAILVSGGAGYIGSHTCVELLAAGTISWWQITTTTPAPRPWRVREIAGKDFRLSKPT